MSMKGSLEKTVTLELERSGVQARVCARQGDSLVHRYLIRLTAGGKPYDCRCALAQVYGTLSDGTSVSADCRILPTGEVEFIPGGGFFAAGGPVICRLALRGDDGGELYSPAFAIDADDTAVTDGATVPAEEYSRLEELLLRVLALRDEVTMVADRVFGGDYNTTMSDSVPLMDGDGSPGVSEEASRGDHTHPTDTTRMPDMSLMKSKATPGNLDRIPLYDYAEKVMKFVTVSRIISVLSNAVDQVEKADIATFARSVQTLDGDRYAILPDDMTEDGVIALVRDIENIPSEEWVFTLADGTTVTKQVMLR